LNSFSRSKLKNRLLLLSIPPLFFIISLIFYLLLVTIDEYKNLTYAKAQSQKAFIISGVIDSMQLQRGYGVTYINNPQDLSIKTKLKELKLNIKSITKKARANCKEVGFLDMLYGIESSQDKFDVGALDDDEIIEYYTKNIERLLDFSKTLPSKMLDLKNRNLLQAYTYLSVSKEALGSIRARLSSALAKDSLDETQHFDIVESNKIFKAATNRFLKTLEDEQEFIEYYRAKFLDANTIATMSKINKVVQSSELPYGLDSKEFFSEVSLAIELLKDVEDTLFAKLEVSIEQKLNYIHMKFTYIALFLALVALSFFVAMRSLKKTFLTLSDIFSDELEESLSLLKQYKNAVDIAYIVSKTDKDGVITYVNEEFCNISGFDRDELLGKKHNILKHKDTPREVFDELWYTISTLKKPWVGEIKNRTKNGGNYWVKTLINPIFNKNGEILEYISIRVDITAQKHMMDHFENELSLTSSNFDQSLHLMGEYESAISKSTIVSRMDKNLAITYVNDKYLELAKYTQDELLGNNCKIFCKDSINLGSYEVMKHTISQKKIWRHTIKNIAKDGTYFWLNSTIVPIVGLDDEIIEYMIISSDVTELVLQKEESDRIAKTDLLTGCGNRYRLELDIKSYEDISIAIFNVDNFRQINDFYGHRFGDKVIKYLANTIYSSMQFEEGLKFYRLQGDEFVILGIEQDRTLFISRVKELLKLIAQRFYIDDEEIVLSCSVGISFEEKSHLLSSANMALKIAKEHNLDEVIYSDAISLNSEYENNIKWTKELLDAIREDRVVAYYQPIVSNKTLEVKKYEALVRIIAKDGKIISPYFFLNIAKQTRQYLNITKIVITKTFEAFKDNDLECSINLSIKDIEDEGMIGFIEDMLKRYNIGKRVIFEIVESESIEKFDEVLEFINLVKRYGAKIAIDDFGTGYSNFEYLVSLRADYLKIDGSLIKNILKDENTHIVVSTIVDFAKKLGLKTVAEFVEDEQLYSEVKRLGIDFSQGYYFSPPISEVKTR